MRVLIALPMVAALALSPVAFAEQKDSDSKVMAQVEKLAAKFIDGFQKQDPSALSKLFTPDGIYVTATGKAFSGQQQIEEALAAVLKAMGEVRSFDTKADEAHSMTGGAWAIGRSSLEAGGSTTKTHWAAVYALDDGNDLRVRMLSVGTDVPPPSTPSASGSTTK